MRIMRLNLSLLILLFLCGASFSLAQETTVYSENYKKGETEAAENLKNEKFILKAWGLSSTKTYSWESADEIYNRILREKYKITFEVIGGCMIDEETADYAEGYNKVLQAGIEAKYGTGILEKVRIQAETEYETKYGEKERELNRNFREGIQALPKNPNLMKLLDKTGIF